MKMNMMMMCILARIEKKIVKFNIKSDVFCFMFVRLFNWFLIQQNFDRRVY